MISQFTNDYRPLRFLNYNCFFYTIIMLNNYFFRALCARSYQTAIPRKIQCHKRSCGRSAEETCLCATGQEAPANSHKGEEAYEKDEEGRITWWTNAWLPTSRSNCRIDSDAASVTEQPATAENATTRIGNENETRARARWWASASTNSPGKTKTQTQARSKTDEPLGRYF